MVSVGRRGRDEKMEVEKIILIFLFFFSLSFSPLPSPPYPLSPSYLPPHFLHPQRGGEDKREGFKKEITLPSIPTTQRKGPREREVVTECTNIHKILLEYVLEGEGGEGGEGGGKG